MLVGWFLTLLNFQVFTSLLFFISEFFKSFYLIIII